jgi:hypothetical protein
MLFALWLIYAVYRAGVQIGEAPYAAAPEIILKRTKMGLWIRYMMSLVVGFMCVGIIYLPMSFGVYYVVNEGVDTYYEQIREFTTAHDSKFLQEHRP